MNRHPATARRTLLRASLAAILALACAKGDRSASTGDTPLVAADSSPISDKSLRPPPEGVEPVVAIRGVPMADSIPAARPDSVQSFAVIDSAVASRPTEGDLGELRRALIVPVSGVTAAALHDTYTELRGGTRPHEALDILAPRGTPVLSAANGRVLKLFNSKPGGLMVYAADSSARFILLYGHLDAYAPGLADGQPLRQGQQIGVVGTTGNAPANTPHLHFAIARAVDLKQWWKGAPVNPYPLLAR